MASNPRPHSSHHPASAAQGSGASSSTAAPVRPTSLFVPSRSSLEARLSRTPSYSGAATLSLSRSADDTFAWRATAHGSSPLERSIDAVGMGRYQWTLLCLAGCGWAADNMWLQGIALIIPRIQDEFGVEERWIGLASSSTFCGMMCGALAWGSCELQLPVCAA